MNDLKGRYTRDALGMRVCTPGYVFASSDPRRAVHLQLKFYFALCFSNTHSVSKRLQTYQLCLVLTQWTVQQVQSAGWVPNGWVLLPPHPWNRQQVAIADTVSRGAGKQHRAGQLKLKIIRLQREKERLGRRGERGALEF